ncbi:hypothetical protein STEG23_007979, partial [Scotinomys teguina]
AQAKCADDDDSIDNVMLPTRFLALPYGGQYARSPEEMRYRACPEDSQPTELTAAPTAAEIIYLPEPLPAPPESVTTVTKYPVLRPGAHMEVPVGKDVGLDGRASGEDLGGERKP